MSIDKVKELARMMGGKIKELGGPLPDGSGFAVIETELPKDHWLYTGPDFNVPPMGMRMGTAHPFREEMAEMVREAAKYAVRCATMNGKEDDFDPDALVQAVIVGLLGYHTPDGLTEDEWANPDPIPPEYAQ